MKLILALVVSAMSFAASAADARTERAERIARVLGLNEMLQETQKSYAESTRSQLQVVLQEVRRSGVAESTAKHLEQLMNPMIEKVALAWDPAQASRLYSEGLLETMTDQELDEAERYVSTPEGQKTYTAIANSQTRMLEYINNRTKSVLQEEFAKFMEQVKKSVGKR